jgi:hypothetical protein
MGFAFRRSVRATDLRNLPPGSFYLGNRKRRAKDDSLPRRDELTPVWGSGAENEGFVNRHFTLPFPSHLTDSGWRPDP